VSRPETTKSLKLRAWRAISLFVRKRDKKCVTCGKTDGQLDCGHFFPNTERNSQLGGNALWYDVRNLNAQCSFNCNRMQSGNLSQYAIYLEKKYGHGILQELNTLYQTPKKWTADEIRTIAEKYEILEKKL